MDLLSETNSSPKFAEVTLPTPSVEEIRLPEASYCAVATTRDSGSVILVTPSVFGSCSKVHKALWLTLPIRTEVQTSLL